MAQLEEASPICRGKNLSWETIILFFNSMPKAPMPKAEFNSYVESRIDSWTRTHSQLARQLAFYYEKDGICYPRFTEETNYTELFSYMQNWAANYFIPNPYAPSLKKYTPTCIYAAIIEAINAGEKDFDAILDGIFNVQLSSHDKIRVYLSNFTDLIIENGQVSLSKKSSGLDTILRPEKSNASDPIDYYNYFNIQSGLVTNKTRAIAVNQPLQQIFYGAPGTGKSFKIDKETKGHAVIRTTFHPDSDYSTFVGAYKPVMEDVEKQVVPVVFNNSTFGFDTNNGNFKERCIAYKFVKQAFTKAYLSSWKKYAENPESPQPQFLVIEEINRGNCAQIFGDLFQLLDRSDNGFSSYPIEADTDLQKEVARSFKEDEEYKLSSNISIEGAVKDYTSNYEATLSEDVQEGRILLLPPNLYIWATMNTSDQSLFPVDSAFKRRWDWVYIPIKNHEEESYKIDIDGAIYDWWGFLEKINNVIGQVTSSEDKKLGYFFVKAPNKVVDAKKFVGKVLFYLWNDVFKNYGFENAIFSKGENKIFTFSEFFDKKGEPETTVVNEFLKKLDETIDKEHSFVSIDNDGSPSSSLIVKYMGEYIEGDTAKSKYIEIIKRVIEEKGVEQVANVIGAELTQTPSDNSREYKPIGDSGWYLVTRIGTRDIIKHLNKIKEQLGVDIVFDRAKEE